MEKERVYVDMDRVLCDYDKAYNALWKPNMQYPQSQHGFFTNLEPYEGAIDAMNKLSEKYDVWILTRPSMGNPMCYTEKRVWVEEHLGMEFVQKLILSPNKNLLIGDYLIDDYQWDFQGKQFLFQSDEYPDWDSVLAELL